MVKAGPGIRATSVGYLAGEGRLHETTDRSKKENARQMASGARCVSLAVLAAFIGSPSSKSISPQSRRRFRRLLFSNVEKLVHFRDHITSLVCHLHLKWRFPFFLAVSPGAHCPYLVRPLL